MEFQFLNGLFDGGKLRTLFIFFFKVTKFIIPQQHNLIFIRHPVQFLDQKRIK